MRPRGFTAILNYLLSHFFKPLPGCRRPRFNSSVQKTCWRSDTIPTPVFLDFPCDSAGKESACHVGDLSSIPGLGRSPGGGTDSSILTWRIPWNIVHGVPKGRTRQSNFHFQWWLNSKESG